MLADYVDVDAQYEKPTEEFLREELEYVVVESWQQAERGLDFIRAELDGRATFLVHPEPNGHTNPSLPEPAIGPETGIAARLSDSLRLTNGFKDRAIDLLPRLSLCFVAEDRQSAQRLAVSYPHLYFLMADGVCYHGHTVTGGKKSSAGPLAMKREVRELAATLKKRQETLTAQVERLEELNYEIVGLEAELERLRALQQSREKDRVALDHEMRKLGDDLARVNSRLSVARLELERLRRDADKSAEQRERNRTAVAEKEQLRRSAKRRWKPSGRRWRSWRVRLPPSAKNTPLRAPNWRDSKSAIAARNPQWAGSISSSAKRPTGATPSPRKSSAWANSARACWPYIELDQRVTQLVEAITKLEARVNEMAVARCHYARATAQRRGRAEDAARQGRRVPGEALAGPRSNWSASRPS
ncbi:MAG: hypothetical protein WDO73_32695 [Ignavibacteriota bacterium]